MGLIGYLIYFNTIKSDDFINSPYNTRQDTFADRVVRGKIMSSDGEVLAQTNVSEDGTEERSYPYNNVFAHVVGHIILLVTEEERLLLWNHPQEKSWPWSVNQILIQIQFPKTGIHLSMMKQTAVF